MDLVRTDLLGSSMSISVNWNGSGANEMIVRVRGPGNDVKIHDAWASVGRKYDTSTACLA